MPNVRERVRDLASTVVREPVVMPSRHHEHIGSEILVRRVDVIQVHHENGHTDFSRSGPFSGSADIGQRLAT